MKTEMDMLDGSDRLIEDRKERIRLENIDRSFMESFWRMRNIGDGIGRDLICGCFRALLSLFALTRD